MRFIIFSGTTEGRELSRCLAEAGAEVTVCVATEYGQEEQGTFPGVRVHTGPLSPEEKQKLLSGADACVDATHPYATRVTCSVREACGKAGVPYLRLLREPSATEQGALVFDGAEEAAGFLKEETGNILLTTGAKELKAWRELEPERLFPRILPSHEGISACEELGIPHRNIIAMQGPFTRELNEAILRQYDIRWLVTKDGGAPGGFPEKAAAAEATGVKLVVLQRPEETGYGFDEILNRCMEIIAYQSSCLSSTVGKTTVKTEP